jgi:hypothetical protein
MVKNRSMNFLRNFFLSLVKARIEEKRQLREEKELKIEEKEKKKKEKVEEKKGIEKIAAKELAPVLPQALPIPKPGEKERMLASMKEFLPLRPVPPSLPFPLPKPQPPAPQPATPQPPARPQQPTPPITPLQKFPFDFGKLNVIYQEEVASVQCIENENVVVGYKDGAVETKEIKLSKDELLDLANKIADKVKIPLQKEYFVYVEDFFVQIWMDGKIKMAIKKIM